MQVQSLGPIPISWSSPPSKEPHASVKATFIIIPQFNNSHRTDSQGSLEAGGGGNS